MKKTDLFVFDTNALLSAFMIKGSSSFRVLEHCRSKGCLLFSPETFLEFELVLFRKKFDKYFSENERTLIIDKVADESIIKSTTSSFEVCRDPKDNMFLNIAIDGKASYIITGDKDLLALNPFKNIPIVTAADFLNSFDHSYLLNEPEPAYATNALLKAKKSRKKPGKKKMGRL